MAPPALSALPWLSFAAVLAWGWRTTDLLHTIPSYGDVLEGLWALLWYDDALRLGQSSALYRLAFHPIGLHVATYAWGPSNFFLLIPLYRIGGAAFAYNIATLITITLAFAGTYLLARRFLSLLGATVAALLYAFWGFRWYGIIGQLNINLGSALLPWVVWSLERGFGSTRRSWAWYLLSGAIWAVAVSSSLYYIWIGGFVVLAWLTGRLLSRSPSRREILGAATAVVVVGGLLSLPTVIRFWRASAAAAAPFFTIYDVNVLGASLNSLPIPYLSHPFLQALARSIYHGPSDSEAGMANLGLLACLLALVGLMSAWKATTWRPVLVMGALGLVLALGLTLRWDDRMVQAPLLRPLNRLIWQVGYALQPSFFFVGPEPPGDFKAAIPLPGLVLATLLPFFSGARVLARYAYLTGLAVFLLAGLALQQVRRRWLQFGLAALLVFEILPPPTLSFVFPPLSHPAFEWLSQQSLGSEGIIELYPDSGERLAIPVGGEPLWATRYHKQATISGILGVWPAHTAYLMRWLAERPHPFQDAEFTSLLRSYQVRYLLLHMRGGWDSVALDEAKQNEEMRFAACYPPASGAQPYDRPICILEVLPSRTPEFNVFFREGWSGPETWGRWIDGTEARSIWVATAKAPQRLRIEAFPSCVPDKQQSISIAVNGAPMATHQWTECENWSGEISIPADLIRVGPNDIDIHAGFSARPIDVSGGENPDPRALSIGVNRLRVDAGS
jgi:hypothetical protein